MKNLKLLAQSLVYLMLISCSDESNRIEWKPNVNASEVVLESKKLSNINLSKAIFSDSKLQNINFQGSNLTNAVFSDSVLIDLDFSGAVLKKAKFTGATLKNIDFTNSKMLLATLSEATSIEGINVSGATGLSNLTLQRLASIGGVTMDSNQTLDAAMASICTGGKLENAKPYDSSGSNKVNFFALDKLRLAYRETYERYLYKKWIGNTVEDLSIVVCKEATYEVSKGACTYDFGKNRRLINNVHELTYKFNVTEARTGNLLGTKILKSKTKCDYSLNLPENFVDKFKDKSELVFKSYGEIEINSEILISLMKPYMHEL